MVFIYIETKWPAICGPQRCSCKSLVWTRAFGSAVPTHPAWQLEQLDLHKAALSRVTRLGFNVMIYLDHHRQVKGTDTMETHIFLRDKDMVYRRWTWGKGPEQTQSEWFNLISPWRPDQKTYANRFHHVWRLWCLSPRERHACLRSFRRTTGQSQRRVLCVLQGRSRKHFCNGQGHGYSFSFHAHVLCVSIMYVWAAR